MNISIKTTTCNNCNTSLPYEVGRKNFFCSYCGAKVEVNPDEEQNDSREIQALLASIDEHKTIRTRQLEQISNEIEQQQKKAKEKINKLLIIAGIGLGLCFVGLIFRFFLLLLPGIVILLSSLIICIISSDNKYSTSSIVARYGGKIYFPEVARNGVGYKYFYIRDELKKAGFTNVTCVPDEWSILILKEEGQIESIKVGGFDSNCVSRARIDPDTGITIRYYSKKTNHTIEIDNNTIRIS